MSKEELQRVVLAWPPDDRAWLAQALWQSLASSAAAFVSDEERLALDQARSRDRELERGEVVGLSHEQVMEAARARLRCA